MVKMLFPQLAQLSYIAEEGGLNVLQLVATSFAFEMTHLRQYFLSNVLVMRPFGDVSSRVQLYANA